MKYDTCDRCDRLSPRLTAVKTLEASFWSPSEWELWCDECCEDKSPERLEALREAAAEKRWEERTGR